MAPTAPPPRHGRRPSRRLWAPLVVFTLVALAAGFQVARSDAGIINTLGMVLLGILSTKLALAMAYRPTRSGHARTDRMQVAAVVAVYNEDPATLGRCVTTLLDQTRPPDAVHLIDDGSTTTAAVDAAAELAPRFAARGIDFRVTVQPGNRGKREALAVGFREHWDADAYFAVDSDTLLEPTALEHALLPMAEPDVHVVTGLVLAANHRTNLLTRLIDLRYGNAFSYERAAYSRLSGSVLCACGSLVVYRGRIVRKYLGDFLGQTFLGRPAVFGDDRRLTNYGLLEGRSVYQETAVAYTAVPERFGHYLRQQSRWNKSFFRESLWVLRTMTPRKPAWWLTGIELGMWLTYTSLIVGALAVQPFVSGHLPLTSYLFFMVVLGYARSVKYLDLPRSGTTFIERLGVFALAPVYGLMHLTVLLPIRLWSLLTLTRGSWGTRTHVEVALDSTPGHGV